ncbi:hypothetical protein [Bradyrhizobium sp. MOS003]|uniref:hypothetical protein n=1 Tax=Bradyrhizobium sp. MOS003 TaxID=2133946 RepID=UPI001313E3FA|nr:hypothetical protein [Bradyrhizobium sp. MOS003]
MNADLRIFPEKTFCGGKKHICASRTTFADNIDNESFAACEARDPKTLFEIASFGT